MNKLTISDTMPNDSKNFISGAGSLIISCGALAKEILTICNANDMQNHLDIKCLPASLHNFPTKIAPALREKIIENQDKYSSISVALADCGTGGQLQKVCDEFNVEYIKSAHCYEFFTGTEKFNKLNNAELGTFYLTDYLVRHFETLIIKGYKLDKIPEMKSMLFSNYKKLVYLSQEEDSTLNSQAEKWADYLGLSYEKVVTGYGELETFIRKKR